MSMEEKIANVASGIIGGSFFVCLGVLLMVAAGIMIAAGDIEKLATPFTAKVILGGLGYGLAIYLLSTLPGKQFRRRIISWIYSSVFHISLVLYIALALNAGAIGFILGMVEILVFILSFVGLLVCLRGPKVIKNA